MSSVDINCSVLTTFDLLLTTLAFETRFDLLELPAKRFLEWATTAAVPIAKES